MRISPRGRLLGSLTIGFLAFTAFWVSITAPLIAQDTTAFLEIAPAEFHQRYDAEERLLFKAILNTLGYAVSMESSDWDEETEAVVRKFQADQEIRIDGKVGPETMKAMMEALQGLTLSTGPMAAPDQTEAIQLGEILKYTTTNFKETDLGRVISVRGDSLTLYDWKKHRFVKVALKDVE